MENIDAQHNDAWNAALGRLRDHLFGRDITPLEPALKRHCRYLTGHAAEAEDLFQETMMRALSLCRICGGPQDMEAYLRRVATNLWRDELRRRRRARRGTLQRPEQGSQAAAPFTMDFLWNDATSTLPPRERGALFLTALCGYTAEEAAALLKTTPASVKMAKSRARKRLREG